MIILLKRQPKYYYIWPQIQQLCSLCNISKFITIQNITKINDKI